MRTIEVKVFTLDELSDKAKERAHNKWLEGFDYPFSSDNECTLNAFAQAFDLEIKHWEYGGRGEGVLWNYQSGYSDEHAELTGIRLLKYLRNNFEGAITKPKYMGSLSTDEVVGHPRIPLGKRFDNGKRFNPYYSAITRERSCNLTGYYMDDCILTPIWNFIDDPLKYETTFDDLLNECMQAWTKACAEDWSYQQSMDCFEQEASDNEWEYDESGSQI